MFELVIAIIGLTGFAVGLVICFWADLREELSRECKNGTAAERRKPNKYGDKSVPELCLQHSEMKLQQIENELKQRDERSRRLYDQWSKLISEVDALYACRGIAANLPGDRDCQVKALMQDAAEQYGNAWAAFGASARIISLESQQDWLRLEHAIHELHKLKKTLEKARLLALPS